MNFMNQLKNELDNGENNVSVTENGALGYRTTGKALLDLNFAVSSLRFRDVWEIEAMFANACAENLDLAIIWMFFARNVRGGMGERRLFRVCFDYLAREFPEKAMKIAALVPEFGRWDDLLDVMYVTTNKTVHDGIFRIVSDQLERDLLALKNKKPVSLLGKWMSSENSSSKRTRARAREMINLLQTTPRKYRVMLSALRKKIDVVERRMSHRDWAGIDYEAVPSKANLLYRDAFMKHDPERRQAYLDSLKNNEKKINASVLFPHEIVAQYMRGFYRGPMSTDETLEALWANLPNTMPSDANVLVVADGSGSMTWSPIDSGVRPLDIANALAIYFADKLSPAYRDEYITFSSRPQYVYLSGASTLLGKLQIALDHNECTNTDIKKTFDLILATAVANHLKQSELPDTILIISDMEFDGATEHGADQKLFSVIQNDFAAFGYKVPKLAFWNVCSRTNTIPVRENPLGVALVSGFSPAVVKMVMSGSLDPYEALMDMLNDKAYDCVREALNAE